MELQIVNFQLIIEGTREKVWKFMMSMMSIYNNKKIVSMNKKCEFKQQKK